MKKVFIDGGAFDGASVRKFMCEYKDWSEYEIYSFEVNPYMIKRYKNFLDTLSIKVQNKINLIEKALWVEDTTQTFKYKNGYNSSGHLSPVKKQGSMSGNIQVNCVNLMKWVKDNFKTSDYIVLKLDIEGAEYEIFKKILETPDNIKYFNKIVGEFHDKKVSTEHPKSETIIKDLKEKNIIWEEWEAIEYYEERGGIELFKNNIISNNE